MTYGYLRVSTDRQDGQNQRLGIDKFAKERGLVIDEYIDDEGVSGMIEPEKRELGVLMTKLKKGDVLIAGEISRLGRSLFMVMRILEFCMKNEIKVYTVKDGYELGNNITSKVLAFAFGLSAEIEREMIVRRVKETLTKKKEEGILLGRPHGTMWGGYKLRGKEDFLRMEILNGKSFNEIAKELNVSKDTVSKKCRDLGLVSSYAKGWSRLPHSRMLDSKYEEIKKMLQNGFLTKDIAKALGLKYTTPLTDFMNDHKELIALYQEVQRPVRISHNGKYVKHKGLRKDGTELL